MDPFTVLLIFLCAAAFVPLLPALKDGFLLIRRAAGRRKPRKKISSPDY